MKIRIILKLIATTVALGLGIQAHAYEIGPGDATWEGSLPKNPDAGDIECIIGGSATYDDSKGGSWDPATCDTGALDELYKNDQGEGNSGLFRDNYDTEYLNTPTDPADANIKHNPQTGSISCSATNPCYLLVKDGDHDPRWYIIDISAWNGTDTLELRGFWPAGGAISHVSIYGGPGQTVPEPGTLALLGLGLFGMGVMRRRRQ